MNAGQELEKKRLNELALRARYSGAACFTRFLEPALERAARFAAAQAEVQIAFYGGFDGAERRIAAFRQALGEVSDQLGKPYTLSASIGCACIPLASGMSVMGVIRIADAKMYENKVQKKLARK